MASYLCCIIMFQLDIIFDVVCMAGHLVTLHMVMCSYFLCCWKSNLSAHAGLEIKVVYLHAVVCCASVV